MTPLPSGSVIFPGTGGSYNFRAHQRESNYPDNPLAIILIARRRRGRVSASLERTLVIQGQAWHSRMMEIRSLAARIARGIV
jgi:hypothetical protein